MEQKWWPFVIGTHTLIQVVHVLLKFLDVLWEKILDLMDMLQLYISVEIGNRLNRTCTVGGGGGNISRYVAHFSEKLTS